MILIKIDYKEKYQYMKKALCTILLATTLCASLISCSKEAQEGMKTVESKTCDFSFQCPESWEITQTDGMLGVLDKEDVSRANVTAYSFTADVNAETTAEQYFEEYKKKLTSLYESVSFDETESLSQGSSVGAHTKYTVSLDGENFVCESVLFLYDGKAYVITLTQGEKTEENEEKYNNHSDEFMQIVKTFKIG